jgi:hypothetical protein
MGGRQRRARFAVRRANIYHAGSHERRTPNEKGVNLQSSEMNKPEKTRSPVPETALPHAGESLRERFRDRWWDILFWGIVPVVVLPICWEEWVHYLFKTPPTPFFATALLIVACVVAVWKIRKILSELPNLQLGAHGERIVGEKLDALRAAGYQVFHDIQEADYNIDHVIIGPEGVFAIETKTNSKPVRGKADVTYDGQRILVNGFPPDRDPLIQAKAAARRVCAILKEMTGSEVEWVQPVVLYPGWYVSTSVKDPP